MPYANTEVAGLLTIRTALSSAIFPALSLAMRNIEDGRSSYEI
jgi:hypothetical protein